MYDRRQEIFNGENEEEEHIQEGKLRFAESLAMLDKKCSFLKGESHKMLSNVVRCCQMLSSNVVVRCCCQMVSSYIVRCCQMLSSNVVVRCCCQMLLSNGVVKCFCQMLLSDVARSLMLFGKMSDVGRSSNREQRLFFD